MRRTCRTERSSNRAASDLGPLAIENRLHHLENIAFTLTHLDTGPVLYLDHSMSSSA